MSMLLFSGLKRLSLIALFLTTLSSVNAAALVIAGWPIATARGIRVQARLDGAKGPVTI